MSGPELLSQRWRTGRKIGRTIYAKTGPEPSDSDPLIGVMDTPELAAAACAAHNIALRDAIGQSEIDDLLGEWRNEGTR